MWINTPALAPLGSAQQTPQLIKQVLPAVASGAVLNVLVSKQFQAGLYEILLNGQKMTARSQHFLEPGQNYRLQVSGFDSNGQMVLRSLPGQTHTQDSALQQRLATQVDPERLFQALHASVRAEGVLPKEIAALAAAFVQRREITSAKRLVERIRQSGLFFERGVRSGSALPSDLKGILQKVSEWLGQQERQGLSDTGLVRPGYTGSSTDGEGELAFSGRKPFTTYATVSQEHKRPFSFKHSHSMMELSELTTITGLKKAVDGALARIESQQILAHQAQQQHQVYLLFELPVLDRDTLGIWRFYVRDEAKRNDSNEEEKCWTIICSVNLVNVGPLAIRLTYAQETTSVTFYSESQQVCGLIDQTLPAFTDRLHGLGFTGVALATMLGRLPENEEPNIAYPSLYAQA